jgi:hypothetical protein
MRCRKLILGGSVTLQHSHTTICPPPTRRTGSDNSVSTDSETPWAWAERLGGRMRMQQILREVGTARSADRPSSTRESRSNRSSLPPSLQQERSPSRSFPRTRSSSPTDASQRSRWPSSNDGPPQPSYRNRSRRATLRLRFPPRRRPRQLDARNRTTTSRRQPRLPNRVPRSRATPAELPEVENDF